MHTSIILALRRQKLEDWEFKAAWGTQGAWGRPGHEGEEKWIKTCFAPNRRTDTQTQTQIFRLHGKKLGNETEMAWVAGVSPSVGNGQHLLCGNRGFSSVRWLRHGLQNLLIAQQLPCLSLGLTSRSTTHSTGTKTVNPTSPALVWSDVCSHLSHLRGHQARSHYTVGYLPGHSKGTQGSSGKYLTTWSSAGQKPTLPFLSSLDNLKSIMVHREN